MNGDDAFTGVLQRVGGRGVSFGDQILWMVMHDDSGHDMDIAHGN